MGELHSGRTGDQKLRTRTKQNNRKEANQFEMKESEESRERNELKRNESEEKSESNKPFVGSKVQKSHLQQSQMKVLQENLLQQLSVTQQKYLFTLYRLQITGVKQSELASEIGVSRPAANRVVQELLDLGLVMQQKQRKISLSQQGEAIAAQLDDQLTAIVQYLMADMEMDEDALSRQALDLALNMSAEYRAACLKKIEKHLCRKPLPQNGKAKLQDVWAFGTYQIPFQLLQQKEDTSSMGDSGFVHPCILQLNDTQSSVILTLCDLNCKSIAGRVLNGRLQQLWYNSGSEWVAAEVTDTECRIPTDGMQLMLDSHGTLRTGELQVRVRASVGAFAMPESYARLKFNFRAAKRIKPKTEPNAS